MKEAGWKQYIYSLSTLMYIPDLGRAGETVTKRRRVRNAGLSITKRRYKLLSRVTRDTLTQVGGDVNREYAGQLCA